MLRKQKKVIKMIYDDSKSKYLVKSTISIKVQYKFIEYDQRVSKTRHPY